MLFKVVPLSLRPPAGFERLPFCTESRFARLPAVSQRIIPCFVSVVLLMKGGLFAGASVWDK